MNRRGFVGAFVGACVLDPERLLWVPGKKLISIPAASVRDDEWGHELSDWFELYLVEKCGFKLSPPVLMARWHR